MKKLGVRESEDRSSTSVVRCPRWGYVPMRLFVAAPPCFEKVLAGASLSSARVISSSELETAQGDFAFSTGHEVVDLDHRQGFSEAKLSVGEGAVPKKPLYYRVVKRAFDVVFSACVIVVGFIPCVILCAFIAADTKGSPIYTSIRVGRGGRPFQILKFRSMVVDSDDLERYFTAAQIDQWHREHKVDDDPRITKLGAFLRSSSIDEIPQFINVLLGHLSVIGPRAITFDELKNFGDNQDLLLSCPPGVTGLWQTGPRNVATFESGLRQDLELTYVVNASLKLDAELFFRTFKTMADGTGK